MIKVLWAEEWNFFNMIKNKNNIHDDDIDIYQRVVTFEQLIGPFENSTVKGQILPNLLMQQCKNIELHILNQSGEKKRIKQMELYFKMNRHSEIVFLFCSHLKMKHANPKHDLKPDLDELTDKNTDKALVHYKLPDNISTLMLNMNHQSTIAVDQPCISCEEKHNINDLTQVPLLHRIIFKIRLKEIIEGWIVDHWE